MPLQTYTLYNRGSLPRQIKVENSKRQIQVTNNNYKKIKLVSNKEMENINKIIVKRKNIIKKGKRRKTHKQKRKR